MSRRLFNPQVIREAFTKGIGGRGRREGVVHIDHDRSSVFIERFLYLSQDPFRIERVRAGDDDDVAAHADPPPRRQPEVHAGDIDA